MDERGRLMIAGYLRVSTPEQLKAYGTDRQREDILSWVERSGHSPDQVRWYEEPGVSGSEDIAKREALPLLLEAVSQGEIDVVVVSALDRLARDVFIQLWVEKELLRHDVVLVSATQDVNGKDPVTKACRQMMAVFAELEKSMIAARLAGGRRAKARKGGFAGGRPPIGYKAVKDPTGSSKLVVDDAEAALVRRIFRLVQDGMTYRAVADLLNSEGVPTKRGGRWHPSTVRYLVQNPKYRGIVRFGEVGQDEQIPADWEALIGGDL